MGDVEGPGEATSGDHPGDSGPTDRAGDADGQVGGSGLSSVEVAAVLRRAAELDAAEAAPSQVPELIAPKMVEEAAVEAGLSRTAVQRALAERAVAAPTDLAPAPVARVPATLTVIRTVPGPGKDVSGRFERFLRRQVFVRERIYENGSRWRPRRGVFATLRRWVDPGGKRALRSVRELDLRVADDPTSDSGAVLVRVDADLTRVRRRQGRILAGTATAGVAGAGWLVGMNGPEVLLLAAPASGGLVAAGWYGGRALSRHTLERIDTTIRGVLDRIEHGPKDGRAALRDASRSIRDAAMIEAAERIDGSVDPRPRSARSSGRATRDRKRSTSRGRQRPQADPQADSRPDPNVPDVSSDD